MILGVAGFQNSGKTTLLEILIPVIAKAGFRVATVKHVAHDDLQIDVAGTDTHRHKKAGARLAVAVSDSESVYFHAETQSLEEILERIQALEFPDLILVEGFKGSSIPKIVVGATPFSGEALYHWDGSTEDATRIAGQIAEELRKQPSPLAAAQNEMARRRKDIDGTLAKLAEREARLKEKMDQYGQSKRAVRDGASDATPSRGKARWFRKREPGQ